MNSEDNIFTEKLIGNCLSDAFESAVLFASNGDLETAVNIMERTVSILRYSDIDCEAICMLGFYCQICLDTNRNDRAVCLYNIAIELMNKEKEQHLDCYNEEDVEMFSELKLQIDKLKPQIDRKTTLDILVEQLLQDSPIWWNAIKDDSDIYIEIRKESYIDAYYNGGAIIKELKWSERNGYQAKIHDKYLNKNGDNKYVKCPLESLSEKLSDIKKRIDEFYPDNSEKGIQAKMILHAKNCYIDSEYQDTITTKSGEKKLLRIDLVRLDYASKKIIFQELKRVDDSRLLKKGEAKNSRELNEIKEQLTLYSDFISQHKEDLLSYYQRLVKIKEQLGLLPLLKMHCSHCEEFTISEEPQLIISDYSEAYTEESKKGNRVKAIIQNLKQEKIDYSFVNINIDGYLYKRYLLSIPIDEWNSIVEMIPWIEKIEEIDPEQTFTDHGGKRTRPLKYVKYKSASVQLMARISKIFMPFDWISWKEGIAILENQMFEELDLLTTCKLLTILLYYKSSTEKQSPLGIPCMAKDLENGLVLKLLKRLKTNIENEFSQKQNT